MGHSNETTARQRVAVIVGAGPAGLTAAYELLDRTDVHPVIYEMSGDIGGISKTVDYKGNRIDLGGHRFFSKSDKVMQWWQNILPLQGAPAKDDLALGRKVPLAETASRRRIREPQPRITPAPDPEATDEVMLVRGRLSRIFFTRKLFDYPITLSATTLAKLGAWRSTKIAASYIAAQLRQIRPETTLEHFFTNRFGGELYRTFFRDYTQKVWGMPCSQISPEWGAQRVKGLSLTKAVVHALKGLVSRDSSVDQKSTETSLIGQFLYPKLGPGQMWEEVARQVREAGGEILMRRRVVGITLDGERVTAVTVRNEETGATETRQADYVLSTMPIKELVAALGDGVPKEVRRVADGLCYRDFMTVGLLLRKLKLRADERHPTVHGSIADNWIYIQDGDVDVGRLQVFNNWSPYMVADENTIWLGTEYFCQEGDALWSRPNEEMAAHAVEELAKVGIIDPDDVLDAAVLRMPKAYPAYFGTYDQIDVVRRYTDSIQNLFLIGRNGMHRYNNQDHSMLSAMEAVRSIANGITSKDAIWSVNTEQEYHEEK